MTFVPLLKAHDVEKKGIPQRCAGLFDNDTDINGEDNIPSEEQPGIKHDNVVKLFEMCIQWLQQNNIDSHLIMREFQEEAIPRTLLVSKTQKKLFFSFK